MFSCCLAFAVHHASAQPPVIEFTFPASVTAIAIETSIDDGLNYGKVGTVSFSTASIVWEENEDDTTRLRVSIDPSYFDPSTGPLDSAYNIVGNNCTTPTTGGPLAFNMIFVPPQDPSNGCSITITEKLSGGSSGTPATASSATAVPTLPLFGLLTLGGLLGLFGLRKLKQ